MGLTATNGINNFYRITFTELELIVLASRHDFTVDFDCDTFLANAEFFQQLSQAGFRLQRVAFTIDSNIHR